MALAQVPLRAFLNEALIPYESDEVTRLVIDDHSPQAFAEIAHLTVGDFRNWLLSSTTDADALTRIAAGLTPEMVAAVSKLMRNQDLIAAARKASGDHALSQYDRLAGPHVGASATESSDRRRQRHRRIDARRSDVRLRRRDDRHQSRPATILPRSPSCC